MYMNPCMYDPNMCRDLRYAMKRSKEAAEMYEHLMHMADCDDMAKKELEMCMCERMEEYQMLEHMYHKMCDHDYHDCHDPCDDDYADTCQAESGNYQRQPFVDGLAIAARREFDDDRFFRRRRFFRRFLRRFGFFGRGGRIIIILGGRRF